jgi:hypothetical protein
MENVHTVIHRRTLARGAFVLLLSVAATTACGAPSTAPTPTSTAATTAAASVNDADEQQLRELYTELVGAMGRHDTAEQVRLTCARYQGPVQRQAVEDDPMGQQIDYLGTREEVSRLGVDAATDKFLAALAPATREAVQAVVEAMIEGDVAQYKTAIQRVEQEGSSATLDRIDKIEVSGDTATVNAVATMKQFTRPPEVLDGSNHAVREDGQWKDCTPPGQRW